MVDKASMMMSYFMFSKIDYFSLYMNLFASFNCWYYEMAGAKSNYEGLKRLKNKFGIWQRYYDGQTMPELEALFRVVVSFCQDSEIPGPTDQYDWVGLMNFWYKVRCDLVHGSLFRASQEHVLTVKLAYDSLFIFMSEVVRIESRRFTKEDKLRLKELQLLQRVAPSDKNVEVELRTLYSKYLNNSSY